jgi:E3 ubiquitin-protein ligase AMFR
MTAVNGLHVAAASTAASAAALQWSVASVLDEARAAGDGEDWLAAVLRSRVTVALLVNLVAHVFLLLILALKVTNAFSY